MKSAANPQFSTFVRPVDPSPYGKTALRLLGNNSYELGDGGMKQLPQFRHVYRHMNRRVYGEDAAARAPTTGTLAVQLRKTVDETILLPRNCHFAEERWLRLDTGNCSKRTKDDTRR